MNENRTALMERAAIRLLGDRRFCAHALARRGQLDFQRVATLLECDRGTAAQIALSDRPRTAADLARLAEICRIDPKRLRRALGE